MPELDTVEWRLVSIETPSETIELGSGDGIPTVRFSDELDPNSEQGRRISGDTGCNTFEGAYTLHDGQALSVEYLTPTEIFCGERAFEVEQAYLSALWSVETYELAGNRLRLFSNASGYALTFISNG